ncbi:MULTISPECIES: transcriptional repressor LexA [Clostridium]|uniref:LexA repressor n=2 Tax=Clostridium novyi TaxID=1542 RepID=LEXA_CLONN|nr:MULTISPECIES: transcriptional repressor LexA [Clostridium]A0Q0N2.1 RecName: Full=LexA repressor [Clostridium novyi NT]ABK61190.1 LexA repressor [Clostridium novyi NT]KEH88561.1 LexA family transcriptional regulator [Clostridium novyi A str. NCTC 538]KEH89500.1 LexA family transcriptional regulator [Clostridium novyi A str. 4540]KEH90670.1 LexA family transcriptional regulator [Clostridium novyi A str. BKT29909]KEH94456.1 LexA family transcriptional regulator [Clostridium botulinum C/D str.
MSRSSEDKQIEIYEFIKEQIIEKGYPPSVREICKGVGLSSTSSVHGHLSKLEKKGLIRRDSTKPRTIEILKEPIVPKEMVNIPILGKVTAGTPILAVENIEDTFPISLNFIPSNKDLFMLKISGESMIDAGILDGDLAIIEKTNTAKNGEIVVALIDNEVTLKRFFKEDKHIRLQPENKNMDPIILEDDSVSIVGKLAGIFRRY